MAKALLGTRPSYELMRDCDTLLVIGSGFPYSQFLPEFGQARAVQVDADPSMVGLRYPFEVDVVGDAGETLKRLIPLLHRKDDRARRDTVEENTARWRQALASDRPYVVDLRTDPAVPPIPPHASPDRIAAAASAVVHGDSDRGSMLKQGFKAEIQEFLPGGGDG
ncbi:hypothetical protein KNE206_38640 [Kitasatospora sp. NE20-6]